VTDLMEVTLRVADALDAVGVPYSVGGSLASSFGGEPRASIDADIVVRLTSLQIGPLVSALGAEFYADPDALRRAADRAGTANLIHRASAIKIDLFVAGSRLDGLQLERRRRILVSSNPDRYLYIHSPEDILLQKLHWYRLGGGVSDRQWRDALAVIRVQHDRLDDEYVNRTAEELGLADLLGRAREEARR
jgi:hypothetical protein